MKKKEKNGRLSFRLETARWSALSVKERSRLVRRLKKSIARRSGEIAAVVSAEVARDETETLSQEVLPALEVIRYLLERMPRWLKENRPYARPGFARKRNTVYREPFGLIALITPGNFPFSLAMMGSVYLLLSGNCVALKPSEKAPRTAALIAELLREAGLAPAYSVVVPGDGREGERLIVRPDVRKAVFFGSRRAGRAVAAQCLRHGKEAILELGGGAHALVLGDAPLKLAAAGLAWSAFYSNGHSCIATERIFVEAAVAARFIDLLRQETERLPSVDLTAAEARRLRSLVKDALARGGEIVCGGDFVRRSDGGFYLAPTLLRIDDVRARIYREEVFGPLAGLAVVEDADAALDLMNRCYQALGVSLWTKNQRAAATLARRTPAGMTWVNDAAYGLPNLPWQGWGEAGRGLFLSADALTAVTRLRWVSAHPAFPSRPRLWWRPYRPWKKRLFGLLARWM